MIDLIQYQNLDGTFTSPNNGKIYCSAKALRSHLSNKGSGGWASINATKKNCQYCTKLVSVPNLRSHEVECYLNPVNTVKCLVCDNPVKNYKKSKGTCSRSCANKHFRRGENNGNWSDDQYRSTCFEYHKKACIICGEDKIVSVHHYDHNHNNNDPANLIPMCPTHHQYVHSRYRHMVQSAIELYLKKFKNSV
jgi:hypothetical protein